MQASPFSYHELNTNNTKTIPNQKFFKNQNFNSNKICIHIIILYKWRCFSRSQTPIYIPTKRKLVKKLLKFIHHMVPHVISQLITRKQNHMVPHVISQLIIKKHNHMVHMTLHNLICESQCTMTKSWNPTTQLTLLNNYRSNYEITLLNYTSSYNGTALHRNEMLTINIFEKNHFFLVFVYCTCEEKNDYRFRNV